MIKNKFRKGIVLGVIMLFVGASVVQGIIDNNGIINDNNSNEKIMLNGWWDTDWNFRKELTINNSTTDYQMILEVWKEDGYDDVINNTIDCEGHCNNNFSDIRFIDSNNINLFYWIENSSTVASDHYARIWIKTTGDDHIYMYYGNHLANHVSNGSMTFLFFDDFNYYDMDKWDEYDPENGAIVTIEEGNLHINFISNSDGKSAGIKTKNLIANYGLIVAKVKGEKCSNPWNQPFCLRVENHSDFIFMENKYRETGTNNQNRKYYTGYRYNNTIIKQYCSDSYPELEWRVVYFKKLFDYQAGGCFLNVYGDNRLGFESSYDHPFNEPFRILIYAHSFDNGLDSYCDWVFVAKYVSDEPSWQSFGDEQSLAEFYGDLDCDGSLRWSNVKPGSTVTGNFTVENIGVTYSLLDWEVAEYPDWGAWTFIPLNGDDLKSEDEPVTVQVIVVAPDEKNTGLTGEVKVVNKEDGSDFCTIPVALATPKNRAFNFNYPLLSWLFEQFPLLQRLLSILEVYVL